MNNRPRAVALRSSKPSAGRKSGPPVELRNDVTLAHSETLSKCHKYDEVLALLDFAAGVVDQPDAPRLSKRARVLDPLPYTNEERKATTLLMRVRARLLSEQQVTSQLVHLDPQRSLWSGVGPNEPRDCAVTMEAQLQAINATQPHYTVGRVSHSDLMLFRDSSFRHYMVDPTRASLRPFLTTKRLHELSSPLAHEHA
jgi:hypothetical protein